MKLEINHRKRKEKKSQLQFFSLFSQKEKRKKNSITKKNQWVNDEIKEKTKNIP